MAWGDFDNDGDLHLFVSNYESPARDFFYRNEGDGTFTKITQSAWVMDSGSGTPAAWGDYDNDGDLDLFLGSGIDPGDSQDLFRYYGPNGFVRVTEGANLTTSRPSA